MEKVQRLTIIDDNELFVFLTKKIIALSEVVDDVSVFDNGLDALEFFKTNIDNPAELPEIVFLDLSMPIMDGWQFLERYVDLPKEKTQKVKIYIITSSISPDDIERAHSINAVTEFLVKPLTKEKIRELVAAL